MLLLISERTARAQSLAVRLSQNGIFSFAVPFETALFFCECKDTGAVAVDCRQDLKKGEALCHTLHARYPDLPIAAWVAPGDIPDLPAIRIFRSADEESQTSELCDFCRSNGGWESLQSTYALRIDNDPEKTLYMGYRFLLSPLQHRILRCLLYRYPKSISADDLMSLCYPARAIPIHNLAAQIQKINLRARCIDPRRLICFRRGRGYCLREGIL